ncbi:hypothetical protein DYB36_011858 [Aphanomyces astaci]|uniref:EF-hand domain-containing protein n=1 Tax=Aphanomyces astaci TaxID=112090 RepID=A0A396ZRA5_APHAT|nr:hypothetical protein DYB36_011858 [Aphanomyces astaci]
MSKEEFVEMMTSFVFDVQQSVGFDTDASRDLLARLYAALEPLRSHCQTSQEAVNQLERQIGRQLALRRADLRTRFLHFDRHVSGYMSYVDFQHALDVLNLDADPAVLTRLFQKYDPQGQGRINYTNFLHLTHVTDSDPPRSEAHDTMMLSHPPPYRPPCDNQDLEHLEHRRTDDLVARIRAKLYQRGLSVRELFLYSYLTLQELHHGFTSILGIDLHIKELMHLTRHFTRKRTDLLSLSDFAHLLEGLSMFHPTTSATSVGGSSSPISVMKPPCPSKSLGLPAPSCLNPLFESQLASVLQDQGKKSRRALFESMAPLGSLSPSAFHSHLRRWGVHVPDDAELVRLVGYFDTNGNGTLEFHEFVRLLQHLERSS